MKEVPKKDLPEVSGGEYQTDGCIPDPFRLVPGPDYPQEPVVPAFDPSTVIDA